MAQSLYEPVTLAGSAARTATGQGDAVRLVNNLRDCRGIAFVFDLTNAATDNADKLDVYVQTRLDRSDWIDIVHFTQIDGDGDNAQQYIAKVSADAAQAEFSPGSALSENAIRNLIGEDFRVSWVVTPDADDPADQTFTFSVTAVPM